jgi:hypothetical protein
MPIRMPNVERRSRIICHLPMNRIPGDLKPNQMRVVHEFIRFLKSTTLTGFTTTTLFENVCTGYWRANLGQEFEKENVVLVAIDHPLDKDDAALWSFATQLKREIQRLYKRWAVSGSRMSGLSSIRSTASYKSRKEWRADPQIVTLVMTFRRRRFRNVRRRST